MKSSVKVNSLPEPFVRALLGCQERLYAYLSPMLRNRTEVDDVLQETNLTICRQVDNFPEIHDFTAWACRVAYYRVLAYRKERVRDRHVFSDETLRIVAEESQEQVTMFSKEQAKLEKCFEKLTPHQQDLIKRRYHKNSSVKSIAQELGRPPNTVRQILCRVRATLLRCIMDMQARENPAAE